MSKVRQSYGEVKENRISLQRGAASELVGLLNQDLATAYVIYHQYKKHHWVVEGPEFYQIHLLLDEHAGKTLKNADRIAERITALGGVPVSSPAQQEKLSAAPHEDEGIFDLREMLERDLKNENIFIRNLREHTARANNLGDYGTELLLKEILLSQEENAHNLDHLLEDETLVKGLV